MRYVSYKKIITLYVTRFFMKFLKLEFIYKNHDTLRYVTFLYTKIQTIRKKQDNMCYVFMYKNTDTLRYAILHGIFEIGRGGRGHFHMQKIHFVLHFYTQKTMYFPLRFIQRYCHFALHFDMKKQCIHL